MFVLSQQRRIFMFLNTSSCKFSDNIPHYIISILEKKIEQNHVFNNWNVVHLDSLELTRTGSNYSSYVKNEILLLLLPDFDFHANGSRCTKWNKLSSNGWVVFASKVRQLTVWFLNRDLGKKASIQPIGTSLSEAEFTVKFVRLKKLPFVAILSLLHDSMTSVLLKWSFSFAMSSLVYTCLDRSRSVWFLSVYKDLNRPTSIFSKLNPKVWFTFAAHSKCRKCDRVFVHYCCFGVFNSISEHFVSRHFKFTINTERLGWRRTLLRIRPSTSLRILSESAFVAGVKYKRLQSLRSKAFAWIGHQVLEHCAS